MGSLATSSSACSSDIPSVFVKKVDTAPNVAILPILPNKIFLSPSLQFL